MCSAFCKCCGSAGLCLEELTGRIRMTVVDIIVQCPVLIVISKMDNDINIQLDIQVIFINQAKIPN